MNYRDHPETEQLIAYSEQPEEVEFRSVGLHLASCAPCRKELQTLSNLRKHAGWISINPGEGSEDLATEVDDLMHHRLAEPQANKLRQRIKQNPDELRQALHYACHHAAMKAQMSASATEATEVLSHSTYERIKDRISGFLQFETPVWKMIPVAIVLVTVVTFLNQDYFLPGSSQLAKVVHFEDKASIQFVAQDLQPGIGFFANSTQTSQPFEGVSISMNNDREMAFSWPEIPDSTGYHLKLQVFKNGEAVVLGRVSLKGTNAVVALSEAPGQHRYEWVLTGDTINKQSFQATGGFVVTR